MTQISKEENILLPSREEKRKRRKKIRDEICGQKDRKDI